MHTNLMYEHNKLLCALVFGQEIEVVRALVHCVISKLFLLMCHICYGLSIRYMFIL